MSQEEIESLMNGLDFGNDTDDDSSESSSTENDTKSDDSAEKMSEDDINQLIAQTDEIISNEKEDSDTKVSDDDIEELLSQVGNEEPQKEDNDESLDDLLNSLNTTEPQEALKDEVEESSKELEPEAETEDVDEILKELEEPQEEEAKAKPQVEEPKVEEPAVDEDQSVSNENIDDLLASIDGITDISEEENEPISQTRAKEDDDEKSFRDIDDKISQGLFPLPVEDDTKVVNQLSIVANDSEEKATKIFDVLSNILDYNTEIQNDVQALASFNEKQLSMLTSLSQKFPNINAFKQNLEQSQAMNEHIQDINNKLNLGNTEIFQAMELMQYHDINRQKIERVMSVIRKLTTYLNNLFEDTGSHNEVAVAKHIHGDKGTGDLMAEDDLEALIAEFNK